MERAERHSAKSDGHWNLQRQRYDGAITISVEGNPLYAGYIVSPNKVEYVTAATGSNPLVLIEVTSSAPKHP